MAGQCLRYAVMELLGFSRVLSPEVKAAMREGSGLHRQFQQELATRYEVVGIERPIRDEAWGVSGRLDAVVQTAEGPAVIEYKTVNGEKFGHIAETGPLLAHWAQLALYMAIGPYAVGLLVVESRESGERLTWRTGPDEAWTAWVRTRVAAARRWQAARKLPEREVSVGCRQCDRWQRCFRTPEAREAAISEHPLWEPHPAPPDMRWAERRHHA